MMFGLGLIILAIAEPLHKFINRDSQQRFANFGDQSSL